MISIDDWNRRLPLLARHVAAQVAHAAGSRELGAAASGDGSVPIDATAKAFWRWKSRRRTGRPRVSSEIRSLIRDVSLANPLWGAPRIHDELLKVGTDVAQSAVAKYMVKGRRPPSQSWKTFLRNHADGIAAVDFLLVPTVTFNRLFALVIPRHDRCRLVHIGVTAQPTTDRIARQLSEAFPWGTAPRYLIRDRDGAYGEVFR